VLLIRTLGELGVYDGDRSLSGATQQPRRLAILALLARAGSRGVSRDHVLAMLWPDADEERGRRTLNQALYALRRDLGSEDAITGTRDLRIDTALVDSDVRLFGEARAAGQLEAAADLWGGPFLHGFNLPGVPEFERWVEQERTVLTHDYADVLATLATQCSERRDHAGAVPWWRRLAALDPLNARTTEQLMRAQVAGGDEAAALRQSEIFAAVYQAELGVAPDPRIEALAGQIRRGELRDRGATPVAPILTPVKPDPSAQGTPVPALPAGEIAAMTVTSGWAAVALPGGHRAPGPSASASAAQGAGRLRSRTLWLAAGVVALGALAFAAQRGRASSGARKPGAPAVIAVGHITDYTKSATGDRSAPLTDMLATNLARVHGFEVVSTSRMYEVVAQLQREGDSSVGAIARAARLTGATELVDGALYELSAGRLRLDLRRVSLTSGSVESALAVEGTDLFALADSATRDLSAAAGAGSPEGTLASVSTQSETAYRFYDAGLRAYSRGEVGAAATMFKLALDDDSAFAMAAYYLGISTADYGQRLAYLRRALALSDRASARDRLYIRSGWGFAVSDPSFLAVAETLSIRFPTEVDGHYWRAQALTRDRRYLEAIPVFERVLQMDSLGVRPGARQCVACDAYSGLTYAYVALDSLAAAERVLRRWIGAQPAAAPPYEGLSTVLVLSGKPVAAAQALEEARARGMSGITAVQYEWSLRLFAENYAGADSVLLANINTVTTEELSELWFEHGVSLRAQGRWREALAAVAHGREATPTGAARDFDQERTLLQLKGQTLVEMGRYAEGAAAFDTAAVLVDSRDTPLNQTRLQVAMLALAASARAAGGDTTTLKATADLIAKRAADTGLVRSRAYGNYLRGLLAQARGDQVAAVQYFNAARYSPTFGLTLVEVALARSLLAQGNAGEAVRVLQPTMHGYRNGGGLFMTRTGLHEELARAWEAAGNADSARAHWARVAEGWKNADPAMAPRAAHARERAAAVR